MSRKTKSYDLYRHQVWLMVNAIECCFPDESKPGWPTRLGRKGGFPLPGVAAAFHPETIRTTFANSNITKEETS
jgi:hypothetical protein